MQFYNSAWSDQIVTSSFELHFGNSLKTFIRQFQCWSDWNNYQRDSEINFDAVFLEGTKLLYNIWRLK